MTVLQLKNIIKHDVEQVNNEKLLAKVAELLKQEIEKADKNDVTPKKKYDFSDLVGKLEWKGDFLEVQKKLRDEWE